MKNIYFVSEISMSTTMIEHINYIDFVKLVLGDDVCDEEVSFESDFIEHF